jgi:ribosomal protein L20
MDGLKKASISLNRKALAELAINNASEFAKLVALSKQHQ